MNSFESIHPFPEEGGAFRDQVGARFLDPLLTELAERAREVDRVYFMVLVSKTVESSDPSDGLAIN